MKAVSSLAVLVLLSGADLAHAGPCTRQIDRLQTKVDALIDKEAGAGKAGKESAAIDNGRQPTPDSIAKAEAAAGDSPKYEKALGFLQEARARDAKGDGKGCRMALSRARKAIATRS